MKKNVRACVWYMITLAGVLFTMTILTTIQGAPLWGWAVAVLLGILQLTGLIRHLHSDYRKMPSKPVRVLSFLLRLSAVGVAGWLALAVFSLASQYHNYVPATDPARDQSVICVEETDLLYIMYPRYSRVSFVTKDRPSRKDSTVTFCCGATFQQTYDLFFDRAQLAGYHVEDGVLYQGYTQKGMGAFTFYDGQYHFADSDEATAELSRAEEAGGCGFQQYMILHEGEVVLEPANEYRCYRVLAELDGQLCIIDAKKQIDFHDFALALERLGVSEALYMDMGSGWNYSWYRDNTGAANTLIGLLWPFSHNWLIFEQ